MDFKTFNLVAQALPKEISTLIRGPHGIGKSQAVRQLATHFDMPMIDLRLGQTTEGDLIGILDDDDVVVNGFKSVSFRRPKWLLGCIETPTLIHFDEINRGSPEVLQAVFQLILDREIWGLKIHPECRIFASINASAEYQVNEMDPALRDRFFIVDLEPTTEDWLDWAAGKIDPGLIDFVRQNPQHLECREHVESDRITPSRRSWERVNHALATAGVIDKPTDTLFYPLCMGLIGPEAAIALTEFIKKYDRQISAEDVLDNWNLAVKKKVKEAPQEQLNGVVEKVCDHADKGVWSQKQVDNAFKFMKVLPGELVISFWTKITDRNFKNAQKLHKQCSNLLLEVIGESSS
jgi:hypothetical protein